jgi:hypothetical protein
MEITIRVMLKDLGMSSANRQKTVGVKLLDAVAGREKREFAGVTTAQLMQDSGFTADA